MESVIEKLLVVQDLDVRIREIEQELKDIPARQDRERVRLASHKEALTRAQDAIKATQADIHRLDLEGKSFQEKINKLRQQQFDLKTNKEFQAMEHEIARIREQISGLEDRELELMDRLDRDRAEFAARDAEFKREEAAVLADVKVWDERAAVLAADLAKVRADRDGSAVGIDPDWMKHYDRVIVRRDRALVQLHDGVCGGCHMKLPPSVHHATRRHESMVICEYCGRLLYS